MSAVRAPLIAISGRVGEAGRFARTPVIFGGRRYFDAVLRAGGIPVMVPVQPLDDAQARDLLARVDALVLTGGSDVDPEVYGQVAHRAVYGVNRESDEFEMALVRAAVDVDLAVLAICRGMQIVNVALGGTLHQHLGDHGLGDTHAPQGFPTPPEGVSHPVTVVAGSRLAKAIGTSRVSGASFHHQAIDRLGEGLRATATADDGVIEGCELTGGWLIGVQWHPEDTAESDREQQRLFAALIDEATERSDRRPNG
jgi:putative glutamine amidotransferase